MQKSADYSDFFVLTMGVLPAQFKEYSLHYYQQQFMKTVFDEETGFDIPQDIPFSSPEGKRLLAEIVDIVDKQTLLYQLAYACLHLTGKTGEGELPYDFEFEIIAR